MRDSTGVWRETQFFVNAHGYYSCRTILDNPNSCFPISSHYVENESNVAILGSKGTKPLNFKYEEAKLHTNIGDMMRVFDETGRWCNAAIIDKDILKRLVLVRYFDFDQLYEEWIPGDSYRLRG